MPTTAFKSDPLVRLMRRRIEDGYYSVKPIPSERGLARESGLSLTCVRRAISQLLEDEVLQRYDNGRLRPAMVPQGNGGQRKIQALLTSVSATRSSSFVPAALKSMCNFAPGLLVPIPTLPSKPSINMFVVPPS